MKIKKISLKKVSDILSDNEMKSISGGYNSLTGVRCYQGNCYCDFHYSDGDIYTCEVNCDMGFCNSMGVSC